MSSRHPKPGVVPEAKNSQRSETDQSDVPSCLYRKFTSDPLSALYLLLGADVAVVSALTLAAVHSLDGKLGVAFSANHLFALVLSSKGGKRGLNLDGSETTSSKSEH